MKTRYFIISGIIAYLVFLIAFIPAAPALALVQNYVPTLGIQGISGSLWNGKAAAIIINRQHQLDNTHWQLNGWRLFLGELSLDISSHYQQQPLSGALSLKASGKISARDVKASLSAATLAQLAQIPLAELSGDISLQLEQLEWQAAAVPHATGIVRWHNAAVTVAETAQLGDVTITLSENDSSPLIAQLSNQGGQIKLEGGVNVSEDGVYKAQLTMLPNASANANIRNSLTMLGKAKPDGSYQLDNTGNLKQFGLM